MFFSAFGLFETSGQVTGQVRAQVIPALSEECFTAVHLIPRTCSAPKVLLDDVFLLLI